MTASGTRHFYGFLISNPSHRAYQHVSQRQTRKCFGQASFDESFGCCHAPHHHRLLLPCMTYRDDPARYWSSLFTTCFQGPLSLDSQTHIKIPTISPICSYHIKLNRNHSIQRPLSISKTPNLFQNLRPTTKLSTCRCVVLLPVLHVLPAPLLAQV